MYRVYANMFSTSIFKQLVEEEDVSYLVTNYLKFGYDSGAGLKTVGDFYKYMYNALMLNYRNEYVYKNHIINKILLGRHNLNTTTALSEFRIGKSIADLVLLNGTSKVYEIKTELDTQYRLEKQLYDYKKVFEQIYIVTHISLADKFSKLTDDRVGVLALTETKTLSVFREAKRCIDSFDSNAMIKCLRKQEYTKIIKQYYGEVPITSQVNYYSVCKEWFAKIPMEILHRMVMGALKQRTIKEKDCFSSDITAPPELKYLLWTLDFNVDSYERLKKMLNLELSLTS